MKNKTIKNMTIDAMIIAIIAIMTFVPNVGYITIGVLSFTTLHLIVLISSYSFSWKKGLLAGAFFGLFCVIKAIAIPTSAGDPIFQNPLISFVPRLIFGLISGFVFEGIRKIKNNSARYVVAIIMCGVLTILHTALVVTMLFIIPNDLVSGGFKNLLGAIFTINMPIEVISAMVIVPAVGIALNKAFPKEGERRVKMKETKYDLLTASYHEDLLKDLGEMVAIDSQYDEKTVNETNPFGEGVSKALKFIEEIGIRDGFKVINYNNMVVEISTGTGNKNITIMAHADVVPEGTGWDQDPFTMIEKDGVLSGRGVADDKGPLFAAYYAMKALRDNNLLGDYQVRFLVGGNEETGSRGIEYYFNELKKPQPDLGFSPDAEFPLIFGEKGITNFEVKKHIDTDKVIYLKGGVAFNSVIEKCEIKTINDQNFIKYLNDNDYNYKVIYSNDKELDLEFVGKAAHGATPELGINAGMNAIKALGEYFNIPDFKQISKCYSNTTGLGINAFNQSDDMGFNSLNVGLMSFVDNEFNMVVNFRYVDTANIDELLNNINEASKPFEVINHGVGKLLYYPKDSVLVSTLLKAYQEETGDYISKPAAIGGGTYAKEANNVVAYGMEMPGWDSKMHSPGEAIRKVDLFKGVSIYANAIVELGKKLNEN